MDDPFWDHVERVVDWLDGHSHPSSAETVTLRILKIAEEAGEVAQAHIGMLGQNPRKGVTHTVQDVADELCDVILSAAVALASLCLSPARAPAYLESVVAARSRRLEDLLEDLNG